MKILYIHQYFRTPEEGGCLRSYHLAKGLVELGHEVSMITTHNLHKGNEKIAGIDVHYLKIPYGNEMGFVRRIWAFLRFVFQTKRLTRSLNRRYDLAYVMTTPLTTGLLALHVKKKYDLPFYFEVGDLWPEVPIKMGVIKNPILKRLLYRFEKRCYFESQKVIALSPAIRNHIEAHTPETKVHVVPNFSDIDFFEPDQKLQQFTEHNPLKIAYIGTFGTANHLSSLLKVAAACLEKNIPVSFTLMGNGADFSRISHSSKKLSNLKVLPFGNSAKVKAVLEAQDAVYVSFKNIEILNTGSPNKFFDGLAAGKLIVLNFGGWVRDLVDKHRCGFYHDPEDPLSFVRKIEVFIKQPDLLLQYQKNARAMAEQYYSKALQVQKLAKILSNEKHLSLNDSEVYILTA